MQRLMRPKKCLQSVLRSGAGESEVRDSTHRTAGSNRAKWGPAARESTLLLHRNEAGMSKRNARFSIRCGARFHWRSEGAGGGRRSEEYLCPDKCSGTHVCRSSTQNGRAGIDLLKKTPDVDIVLMDIMMPEMDGYHAPFGRFPSSAICRLSR
jgi:hypothetical protein